MAVRKKSATKKKQKKADTKDPKLNKIVDQLQKRNSDRGYVLALGHVDPDHQHAGLDCAAFIAFTGHGLSPSC